jgi:uncharacterized DUF497 family protein
MLFTEWDEDKAAANILKHGISFEEAADVFDDPLHVVGENLEFEGEQRYDAIGFIARGLLVHVTYVDWMEGFDVVARIISARKATQREERIYGQNR